ncbi:MAG TPA: hypothetical protein VNQ53_12425 [Nocardioides sp.]|nr:hypothetical protein [Nocardioides sp.]
MRAAFALVVTLFAVAGCGDDDSTGGNDEPSSESPASDQAAVEVDGGPVGIADVGGETWTVLPDKGEVRTADDTRIPVGEAPLRIAATPDGVWVSVIGDGTVVRIDPATGEIDQTVTLEPARSEPEGLAWDGAHLWVVDQANARVVQLAPDGAEVSSTDVGEGPRLTAAGPSGIWVTNYVEGSLSHIADAQGSTISLPGCTGPQGVAELAGKVWVACTVTSSVVALDVESREVVSTIEEVPDADAVVAHEDTVYVVGQSGPTVYAIDAATGEIRDEVALGDAPRTQENVGAAVVGDELVVTHPDARTIYTVPLP